MPDNATARAEFERIESNFARAAVARGDALAALVESLIGAAPSDAPTVINNVAPTLAVHEGAATGGRPRPDQAIAQRIGGMG